MIRAPYAKKSVGAEDRAERGKCERVMVIPTKATKFHRQQTQTPSILESGASNNTFVEKPSSHLILAHANDRTNERTCRACAKLPASVESFSLSLSLSFCRSHVKAPPPPSTEVCGEKEKKKLPRKPTVALSVSPLFFLLLLQRSKTTPNSKNMPAAASAAGTNRLATVKLDSFLCCCQKCHAQLFAESTPPPPSPPFLPSPQTSL